MNARKFYLLIVVTVVVSLSSGMVARTLQNLPAKDPLGGAGLLFKPPQNPSIQRRKNQPSPSTDASKAEKAVARLKNNDNVSDKVEDAIELGNAARDRRPPDFASAEKAYRLAWKLNPRDARPHVGLGNVYFDQQRYSEAAQAYRDALKLQEPTRVGVSVGAMSMRTDIRSIGAQSPSQAGQVHVYLATAMLRQQDLSGAELELRRAVTIDSKNAAWHALLGYALFTQKRYTEAAAAYKLTVNLDPNNSTYKELLGQASLKSREAFANDAAMMKRLEDTQWEIKESASGKVKRTCRLRTGQRLDCGLKGNKLTNESLMKWKVQDGLFKLEQSSTSDSFCIGEMQTDRIKVECSSPEKRHEVWIKLSYNFVLDQK